MPIERDRLPPSSGASGLSASTRGIAAGLAVGGCLTWNVSNVGAVADPLAEHYDVSLVAVGLLTTALFVIHFLVQLPAGRGADRFGARAVALVAIGGALAGNALLLVDGGYELALVGRTIVGIGSGAGFVAGLDLVRAGGGGAVLQGVYGGATMAGAGLRS
ncbi:MAG TPA: MFS transporter [Gaiellaceae bacterium]|nr:MFS transporter [Gaiellaceae bacterium]